MTYHPKFCCQCAEPIERANWNFLTSKRFCRLCETDYWHVDWIPRIIVTAGILFGVFGLGTFLRKPDKPLNLASSNPAVGAANINKNIVSSPISTNANNQSLAKTENTNIAAGQTMAKSLTPELKQFSKTEKAVLQPKPPSDVTYFCGAETKKGTPCTRRVKGGGRCFQHKGLPAMLPPEKLIASR